MTHFGIIRVCMQKIELIGLTVKARRTLAAIRCMRRFHFYCGDIISIRINGTRRLSGTLWSAWSFVICAETTPWHILFTWRSPSCSARQLLMHCNQLQHPYTLQHWIWTHFLVVTTINIYLANKASKIYLMAEGIIWFVINIAITKYIIL